MVARSKEKVTRDRILDEGREEERKERGREGKGKKNKWEIMASALVQELESTAAILTTTKKMLQKMKINDFVDPSEN